MTDDRIELRGLRVNARCGVLPLEREQDQPLEFDVDLWVDLSASGASDALADTIDYGAVCELVASVCAASAPQLLERLATSVADAILAMDAPASAPLTAVTVAVRKLRPPVPRQLATSGVRITRSFEPSADRSDW